MINLWITAWLISAVCAAGAWFLGRRSGLTWLEAILFVAIFFPAPLFVALGGGNSFVYAFDLVVPLAVVLAVKRWGPTPLAVKKAALWLLAGVGAVPLLVAGCLANRECVLYAGINLYRLLGALCLMCVMSVTGQRLGGRSRGLLGVVSWMNLVLVLSALAQSRGWINSNVFYNVANENSIEENESLRFITAGLFRGSLGILGTLGWVAFLAQHNARGWAGALAVAGGAAGGLLIILCGSKTSLLAVIFVTVTGCLLFKPILRQLWVKLAVAVVMLIVVAGVYLQRLGQDRDYFVYTLGVLGLSDSSLETFNYRHERWREALEFMLQDPKVLMGVATPFGADHGMGYFHNEYLSLLMSGGVWSAGAYALGLFLLGRGLARQPRLAGPAQVFGALTLLAGFVQAAAVNHLAPGIFFGCTAMIMACAYGLGFACHPVSRQRAIEEAVEGSAQPATGLQWRPLDDEQAQHDDGAPAPTGGEPQRTASSSTPHEPLLHP